MTRAARPEDRSRLRAIQTVSLAEPWPDLLDTAIDGAGIVRVVTAEQSPDPDAPVGYAVALPEGERAYIAEFAVAPTHRRAGYGSRLMTDLLAQLSGTGVERVDLTVQLDDEQARSFYETHGFRVRSLVPEHYESGDALRLVRPVQ